MAAAKKELKYTPANYRQHQFLINMQTSCRIFFSLLSGQKLCIKSASEIKQIMRWNLTLLVRTFGCFYFWATRNILIDIL